jgi:flavin-dependent dehydrogenase
MAMAIHSGKLAVEAITPFLKGEQSHKDSLEQYRTNWNTQFKSRLRMGRWLQGILLQPVYTRVAFSFLKTFPVLLPFIIKKTHGKPI